MPFTVNLLQWCLYGMVLILSRSSVVYSPFEQSQKSTRLQRLEANKMAQTVLSMEHITKTFGSGHTAVTALKESIFQ